VAAAYALGELGDTVDTGALVALLRDPERTTFMVAREAILALGVLRDAESVSGLAHDREL
jgi:HEAT repeat protein